MAAKGVCTINLLGGSLQEQGQASLREHVARVVAGCAVHTQANIDTLVQQIADGRYPCRSAMQHQ